jgi:hypothetical protein
MHKKTKDIIENLGFGDEVVELVRKRDADAAISRRTLTKLKELGMPKLALDQIKVLESGTASAASTATNNKELLESLLRKCRRSLDAFANKNVAARIVFSDNTWTIFSEEYSRPIEKLHKVCKVYFDEWSAHGLKAILIFDGSSTWKVSTDKESDLPDIGG